MFTLPAPVLRAFADAQELFDAQHATQTSLNARQYKMMRASITAAYERIALLLDMHGLTHVDVENTDKQIDTALADRVALRRANMPSRIAKAQSFAAERARLARLAGLAAVEAAIAA